MKLWLLKPIDDAEAPWHPWYDKMFGFVVRAETEKEARIIAMENQGDEGKSSKGKFWQPGQSPWLDPEFSTCVELTADGEPGLILADFHAG